MFRRAKGTYNENNLLRKCIYIWTLLIDIIEYYNNILIFYIFVKKYIYIKII